MRYGISTACLYPAATEQAVDTLLAEGVRRIEIFFNTSSEIALAFMREQKKKLDACGAKLVSLHPYTSEFEPFLFFSDYDRRTRDAIDLYERYFEAMEMMDCHILVFHGDWLRGKLSPAAYAERFCRLAERGRRYGVTVAHENVSRCRMGRLSFLRELKPFLGEYAAFVLDIKQALRAGEDPFSLLEEMGRQLVHLHISDSLTENGSVTEDCLPPGAGNFDMARLFSVLDRLSYRGNIMVELYRRNYDTLSDLIGSYHWLQSEYGDR